MLIAGMFSISFKDARSNNRLVYDAIIHGAGRGFDDHLVAETGGCGGGLEALRIAGDLHGVAHTRLTDAPPPPVTAHNEEIYLCGNPQDN